MEKEGRLGWVSANVQMLQWNRSFCIWNVNPWIVLCYGYDREGYISLNLVSLILHDRCMSNGVVLIFVVLMFL